MQYSRNDVAIGEYGGLQCRHRTIEIRRRTQKNGVMVFVRQCLTCGENCGAVAKTSRDVLNLAVVHDYDETLHQQWWDACQQHREQQREYDQRLRDAQLAAQQAERREEYEEYIASIAWKRKRAIVMDRANGICECCGITQAAHVHHLTYEHFRNEYLWELKAVCLGCHQKIHPDKDIRR